MKNSFKDKIKFFEPHGKLVFKNNNNKPRHTVTFEKGFDKKCVISENKENASSEKTKNFCNKSISKELQTFINDKPVFPCLLISKDDIGKIEMNMNCLNDIDIDKIKIISEDSFEIAKRKEMNDSQTIDFSNYQFDISVIHNNANFLKKTKSNQKTSYKNNSIIGKYKLYSFNINEGDLSFNQYFIDKFNNIANDISSDTIKAKEIDEIFENQGYYIPLKIYIGGLFINKYNKENIRGIRDSLISLNKKLGYNQYEVEFKDSIEISSENKINQIFINENTQIIGGDRTEKNFDKWIKSIKIFNSNLIECTNIIEAKNILPNDLKQKLKVPLQLVEQKYLSRKKYVEIIKSLRDIIIEEEKGYDNISKGICQVSNIPVIYVKIINILTEEKFLRCVKKNLKESFSDIIVGFKIEDNKMDGLNGEWKIYSNPLLQKEINMRFWSQISNEQDFSLYVYLMKFPE